MGNLWLLIAAPATVLAAVLFWNVFDIGHADYIAQRADVKAERAAFNAEFAEAFNGKPDAELIAKAKEADDQRKKLEAEAEAAKAKNQAQASAEVQKLDTLLNFPSERKEN